MNMVIPELTTSGDSNTSRMRQVVQFLRNNKAVVLIYIIILIVAGLTAAFSEVFRSPANIMNIFRQSIALGLLAIGQSVVILTGGMDVSTSQIARIVCLVVATFFALTESNPAMIIPLIALGIVIGVILGGLNGILITRTHAVPFIITLGMASVLRGVNLAISTTPIRGVPSEYLQIYNAKIGIVPINVLAFGAVWILAWLVMTRTRMGRSIYAVGGSERIAQLSAIRINRSLVLAYVISGLFAALAGLMLLSRMGVGDPSAAEGMDFQSVAAVALGGISLYGGKGSILGTLGGVLLLTMMSNVFVLMQIDIYFQTLVLGTVMLIAVAAYKATRKRDI